MSFNRHLFLHRVSRRAGNRTFSRRFGGRSCQAFLKSLDVSGLWLATLSINSSCRLWGSDLRNWYFNCSSSQFFVLHCTTLKIWMKGARLIGGYAFFLGGDMGRLGGYKKLAWTKKVQTSFIWRRGRDSNPCALSRKLISSQPRYDHFDTSPYMFTPKMRETIVIQFFRKTVRCAG